MELVLLTGQDFGYDVAAWEEWFDTNRANLADIYLEVEKKRNDEMKHGRKFTDIVEEIRQKHK